MATQDEVGHLRQRLSDEGEQTADFFAGLAAGIWSHPVYAAGPAWHVRDVLAHFVSAERVYLHYMRDRVAGGSGVPRDFDIDAFNAAQTEALAGQSPAQLLEAFRQVRQQTCAFVAGLKPEDLDLIGYHPWFGDESLRFLLKLIYRHPMLHVRDIRRAIQAGEPLPEGESSFPADRRGPLAEAGSAPSRKQSIADHMRQSHAASWAILTGLQENDLGRKVYGDGEALWSVGDLLAHLADAESGMLGQVRRLLAGQPTVPDDFDLDRWNRSAVRRNRSRPLPDLLDQILRSHQDALATLEAAEETSLDLMGRHSSGEVLTVEGYFRRIVDHRMAHSDDIDGAVRAGGNESDGHLRPAR